MGKPGIGSSHDMDDIDEFTRNAEAEDELRSLKASMVHNETIFIRDMVPVNASGNNTELKEQLGELEEAFQRTNERLHLAKDPGARTAIGKLKNALAAAPHLVPYAIIKIKTSGARSPREFEHAVDAIEKKCKRYRETTERMSHHGMLSKLQELGNLRSRILRVLEESPASGVQQVRQRITTSESGEIIIKNIPQEQEPVPSSSTAKIALAKYAKELDRFILHLAEHPEEIRLDHIGYDMTKNAMVMRILERLEKTKI